MNIHMSVWLITSGKLFLTECGHCALAGIHWNGRQQGKSLSCPPCGDLDTLVVRVPVGLAKSPRRPPLPCVAIFNGTLSAGQRAMAAVTGLFVLIKHAAKAIFAYVEGNC